MIIILKDKINPVDLQDLCAEYFETFVKFVADIKRKVIAIGGELHSDAEHELLTSGSSQHDLWGANFYPHNPVEERLEYTSLINIRPRDNNTGMEIEDNGIREKIRQLAETLILSQQELLDP